MNFDCPYCKQKGIESTVTWDGNVDHRFVECSAIYKHYMVGLSGVGCSKKYPLNTGNDLQFKWLRPLFGNQACSNIFSIAES